MINIEERIKNLSESYKGMGLGEVALIYEDGQFSILIGNSHGIVRMGETWELDFAGASIEEVFKKAEDYYKKN